MSIATAVVDQSRARARTAITFDRVAGVGGLVFAAILLVQNILRTNAPSFNASPSQVTSYFLHHRTAVLVPLGLYPIAMLALFIFVAGVWMRADGEENRRWASVGALGAMATAGVFTVVYIAEIVLVAKAGQLAPSPGVVQALWTLHGAAFGLNMAAFAVALIGLSRAAASMRLIPAWLRAAALPAAACLIIASMFTVALTNGGPWIALGSVGFIVWLVFVLITSVSLLRRPQVP